MLIVILSLWRFKEEEKNGAENMNRLTQWFRKAEMWCHLIMAWMWMTIPFNMVENRFESNVDLSCSPSFSRHTSTRGLCLFTKKPKPKPKQTKPNHNLILFQCQWGVWMLHCLLFVQATNSVWMRIALSLYGGNNTCNQHQNSVFSLWNQKDTVTLNSINLKRYCYARSINLS